MYTEDDKELTVKKNNSNAESSDFYTSFNTNKEKEQEKSHKNIDKKTENPKLRGKRDYSDFYSTDYEIDIKNNKDNNNNSGNKKFSIIIIVTIILFVLLIGLIIVL